MDAFPASWPDLHPKILAAFPVVRNAVRVAATSSLNSTNWQLCSNSEGWGPVAGEDLHITDCFLYGVLITAPAVFMLIVGTIQLVLMLLTQPNLKPRVTIKLLLQVVAILGQILAWAPAIYSSKSLNTLSMCGSLVVASLLLTLVVIFRERRHSNIPSGSVLLYWALSTVTGLVGLVFGKQRWHNSLVFWHFAASTLSLVLESWPRKNSYYQTHLDPLRNNPMDQANVFSRLTFSWMTPLMKKGYEKELDLEDLPELPFDDHSLLVTNSLEEAWDHELAGSGSPSLYAALFKAFGARYAFGGACKMVQDSLSFVQPQLLRLLIEFVQSYQHDKSNLTMGFYIAIGMFLTSIVQTMFLHQYFERSFTSGMRVRTALTNMIYKKSLRLSTEARGTRTIGDTVNLMSIDTQRLQDLCPNGHMLWSGPFQIIICLISLYSILGRAMWSGVALMIVLIPVNSYAAGKSKKLQQAQMKSKDLRTRMTNELLSSIKSVKLYAWEKPLLERLQEVRENEELGSQRKLAIFWSFISFLWTFAPFSVSFVTFTIYNVINDEPLTSSKVFPAISLFNLLQFPLAMFPMLVSNVIQASVAVKRITDFLQCEELQKTGVNRIPESSDDLQPAVEFSDATFLYQKDPRKIALENIELQVPQKSLHCIIGKVGAGKTSFLSAILGDLYRESGSLTTRGSIAYAAQNSWIFNGTVMENILFGLQYDKCLYKRAVFACALSADFDILPQGDQTLVGEKGISLSGGQKARISLARAVYSQADILLLDDPLSAVDEHVGKHITKHVLGEDGLLANRTVILATNSIPVLQHADQIVMLEGGRIIETGTYTHCGSGRIKALLDEFSKKEAKEDEKEADVLLDGPDPEPEIAEPEPEVAAVETCKLVRPEPAEWKVVPPREVQKEHVERGKVSWKVYAEYARTCGFKGVAAFCTCLILSQSLSFGGNLWLKHWSEMNNQNESNQDVWYYVGIYGLIGISSAIAVVCQNLLLTLACTIRGARILHNNMLSAVVRAPMSFFETTPIGRIINRFSSDVYKVDQQLSVSFYQLFSCFVRILFTILLISFSTPAFLIEIFPLCSVYLWYQGYYLRTSRELKRLESTSKSPIFAQFQETLDGISTIRAYRQAERYSFINESYLDGNNKAYSPSVNANRWLAVRLEFFGSVIIASSALLSVASLPSGKISAGTIGLAMSYALSITQTLNWLVRMTVEVETNIVSVERMMEYTKLTPEAPEIIKDHRPELHWPSQGGIIFDDFSCRYRSGLPQVLKNITLNINAGEKIGIVGRTGAGKSSLSLALFRLIEGDNGHIVIDGLTTSEIGLQDLRSSLSIIPQDAQLFEGTIRSNIDPHRRYSDVKLWQALEVAHLKEHIVNMGDGLDSKVSEAGANLSAGQRQLVCLTRAVLTDTKVLVMDEATASVDVETDKLVQQTIREIFKDRTILTIAHRLNTIMDSDRVLVLSFGEVAEFDTPENLLNNKDSLFYALANARDNH